jgi:hypothetical protein
MVRGGLNHEAVAASTDTKAYGPSPQLDPVATVEPAGDTAMDVPTQPAAEIVAPRVMARKVDAIDRGVQERYFSS